MGSVVEMRFVRRILLAIMVAVALVGGVASTAYADTGALGPSLTAGDESTQCDPSDPGLPPD
jgi:hypothetical protein